MFAFLKIASVIAVAALVAAVPLTPRAPAADSTGLEARQLPLFESESLTKRYEEFEPKAESDWNTELADFSPEEPPVPQTDF